MRTDYRYAVVPSFFSYFTTYCLDPYFIYKLVCLVFVIAYSYTCVTVLLG